MEDLHRGTVQAFKAGEALPVEALHRTGSGGLGPGVALRPGFTMQALEQGSRLAVRSIYTPGNGLILEVLEGFKAFDARF